MTDREMDAVKRRLKSYVKKREENYIKWLKSQDVGISERIKQILKRTSDEILKETTRLMLQFADNDGNISPAQMSLLVENVDMQYLAEKAEHYVELANRKNAYAFSPEANAEMKQYNWTMKVSRQELLRRHLNLEISKMTKEVEGTLSTYLEDLTVKELQRQAGILNLTISDSESLLNKAKVIANADFYGQTFSERLWKNSEQLMQKLELGVSETMLMGKNPKAWSKMFRKELKDNVKNAKQVIDRLAVTEAGRVQIMAQEDSYRRNNFTMYEIITEPDACKICLQHNEQVYNTQDLQIGLNAPVWHPNCRCTTTPYISDEEVEEAISKLESYRNMTDEELFQELIAKGKIKEYISIGDYKIKNSGALSGALNDRNDPYGERRERHAKRYYKSVRNRDKDNEIRKISKHSNMSYKDVTQIYEHIFTNVHLFKNGKIKRFDPSYAMSQSWQRILQGENIQKHDIIMLKHELLESEIMKNKTIPYEKAHEKTDKIYNYNKALIEWEDKYEHNS